MDVTDPIQQSNPGSTPTGSAGGPACMAVRQRIAELAPLQQAVVTRLYGVGCAPSDPQLLAAQLGLSLPELWQCVHHGVEEIGFRLLTEVAA